MRYLNITWETSFMHLILESLIISNLRMLYYIYRSQQQVWNKTSYSFSCVITNFNYRNLNSPNQKFSTSYTFQDMEIAVIRKCEDKFPIISRLIFQRFCSTIYLQLQLLNSASRIQML